MKEIIIYTDGACSNNPGPGGWGAILIYGDAKKEINGFDEHTTNNRMELLGPICALKQLKEECSVKLHSDSAYLCNAFNNGWLDNWQRNNWQTSQKKPVENKDLWLELLEQCRKHTVLFVKVKGHSDNANNNRCDELARDAIKKGRQI